MMLVTGASGQLCSLIVHGLLRANHQVRALVTHTSPSEALAGHGPVTTIQSLKDAGAKPMWGDMTNKASLRAALAGVDTVIAASNPVKQWGKDSIEPADRGGMWNLIDEAGKAGVRRFLLASLTGAAGQGRQIAEEYERALRASGMNYTIVRPTILMEAWIGMLVGIPMMTQQTVMLIGRGDKAHNFISVQDVADYFVAMVDHPDAYYQTVTVGGPASFTWTQIVDLMRDRVGADLPIQYAMAGTPIPYLPQGVYGMVSQFEGFEDHLDITQTAKTYGVRPTTLEEYIDQTFGRSSR